MTRRPTRGRTTERGLRAVGPDGLPPSEHLLDADPVDEPGSWPDPPAAPSVPSVPSAPSVPAPPPAEPSLRPVVPLTSAAGPPAPPPAASPAASAPAPSAPAPSPASPVSPHGTPAGPRITVPARPGGRVPRTPGTRPARRAVAPTTGSRATGASGAAQRDRSRAERFAGEDPLLADMRARSLARDLAPAGVGTTATLTFLAATLRARAVVEVGTGLGVGTVSLLRGMPPEGLLTSIDLEAEHQRLARIGCVAAGFAPGRTRMISGRARDLLPRLSDRGYDLVVVDADVDGLPVYLTEGVRLLRPGGVLVLCGMLADDPEADTVRRDELATLRRETARAVREDERLAPVMLPLSDGLLCAAVR